MKYLCSVFLFMVCAAGAQSTPAPATPTAESITPLIHKQFGPTFAPASKLPLTVLTADFDADGVEDVVIVADSKDPLPDSYQFKYDVADPYNAFFGMGDPRMTAGYGKDDPEHNHQLLVIFGAGAEAWHAATPKAKFVLINVPFDSVEIGRLLMKKNRPPIFMIRAVEAHIMDSTVFWDAKKKKWKWQPGDTLE